MALSVLRIPELRIQMRLLSYRAVRNVPNAVGQPGFPSIFGFLLLALLALSSSVLAEMGVESTNAPLVLPIPVRSDSTAAVPVSPFVTPWIAFNTSMSAPGSGSP